MIIYVAFIGFTACALHMYIFLDIATAYCEHICIGRLYLLFGIFASTGSRLGRIGAHYWNITVEI